MSSFQQQQKIKYKDLGKYDIQGDEQSIETVSEETQMLCLLVKILNELL